MGFITLTDGTVIHGSQLQILSSNDEYIGHLFNLDIQTPTYTTPVTKEENELYWSDPKHYKTPLRRVTAEEISAKRNKAYKLYLP